MVWQRLDNRFFDQLRPFKFELDFTKFAQASVLTSCGDTKVLCTVSVEEGVPPFLRDSGQGWLTAEYRMMPGATPERQRREFMKLSGRTQEIQRLIGRSLRAAIDLKALGERTITIDADVLQADGGTRTTAITGGYVGLAIACERLVKAGILGKSPIIAPVAAISVGLIAGQAYLDLNYLEDVAADVDFNVVMIGGQGLNLIEVQGTAEAGSYNRAQLNQILDVAEKGIQTIMTLQTKAIH
ncbi:MULTISPECIES: ribonuclease PH [Cyanophyceae]|uniref:ribonuclease PH n=1 Tax=Cyanophyceae TaxID=3028117 RepID=UPI00016DCC35|nr:MULTISPECIES: ribonuclease PH [Cyanophyceae]ACB00063.1 ribonuclease PH [Picosynechococcus sp. PCC 7002]SMH53861.1 RNAse PH [Picosynechococcus sp. OG1]SMQ82779.1 RNAse PH [Synechococcus sp. 7002]